MCIREVQRRPHMQAYSTLILGITVKSSGKRDEVEHPVRPRTTTQNLQDLRYVPSRTPSANSSRPAASSSRPISQHASVLKEPRTNLATLSSHLGSAVGNGRLAQRTGDPLVGGGTKPGLKLFARSQASKPRF